MFDLHQDIYKLVMDLSRVREYMYMCREACLVKDLTAGGTLSIIYMSFYGVEGSAGPEDVFYLRYVNRGWSTDVSHASGGGDDCHRDDNRDNGRACCEIMFLPLKGPSRSSFRRQQQSRRCFSIQSDDSHRCTVKLWCVNSPIPIIDRF